MDGDHTEPPRLDGREAVHGVPVDDDGAGVGRGRPRKDAHQGGLARAVFADEGVNLARAHVERGVGKRADAGVGFGQMRRDQHRLFDRHNRDDAMARARSLPPMALAEHRRIIFG